MFEDLEEFEPEPIRRRPKREAKSNLTQKLIWLMALLAIMLPLGWLVYTLGSRWAMDDPNAAKATGSLLAGYICWIVAIIPWSIFVVVIAHITSKIFD